MRRETFTVLALAASLIELAAHGEVPPDFPWTLDCVEIKNASPNNEWTDFEVGKDEKFEITFSRTSSEEFVMIGNLGAVELMAITDHNHIQLFEAPPLGGVTVTSIETTPTRGKYRAVHSRHSFLFGQLVPSQYILSCSGR